MSLPTCDERYHGPRWAYHRPSIGRSGWVVCFGGSVDGWMYGKQRHHSIWKREQESKHVRWIPLQKTVISILLKKVFVLKLGGCDVQFWNCWKLQYCGCLGQFPEYQNGINIIVKRGKTDSHYLTLTAAMMLMIRWLDWIITLVMK